MSNESDRLNRRDYVTLKEYTDDKLDNLEKFINDKLDNLEKSIDTRFESVINTTNSALSSADKAVNKAEAAAEKRFEGLNEFRGQQKDIIETFARKTETNIQFKTLDDKIDNLNEIVITMQSKGAGQKEGAGFVALVAGVVSAAIGILFKFI